MTRALIFDCDGVIVDAEIHRHLRAFNQVWAESGIPWQWSEAQYTRAVRVSGGKERLFRLRDDPAFRAVFDVPDDVEDWKRIVASWHRRKTAIYVESIRSENVEARSGVRRLAGEALSGGWRVAVASAGARESVTAVVTAALGDRLAAELLLVTGESVQRKKPSPQVFEVAAARAGIDSDACLVIEDTRNGLRAATAAGMTCVVTPTRLNWHDDFSEAALVVSGLGDPGARPVTVLGGDASGAVLPYLTLGDLEALMPRPPGRSSRGPVAARRLRRSDPQVSCTPPVRG